MRALPIIAGFLVVTFGAFGQEGRTLGVYCPPPNIPKRPERAVSKVMESFCCAYVVIEQSDRQQSCKVVATQYWIGRLKLLSYNGASFPEP